MTPKPRSPQLTGIEVRHDPHCRVAGTGRCSCRNPRYRGRIAAGRSRRLNGPWTASLAEARSWRSLTLAKLEQGEDGEEVRSRQTVAEAAEEWIEGVRTESARNRAGRPYKPSAARAVEAALRLRVIPTFGRERLAELDRPRLQRWVRSLMADGLDPSTVRNTIGALRVLYREAIDAGEAEGNPTLGLKLPVPARHEPRLVERETAAAMLAALPLADRAIWATAFYGGLRRGELWALRWGDVDLDERVIRVRRSLDAHGQEVEPKSAAGRRAVPITPDLAEVLEAHRAASDGTSEARAFPGARGGSFGAGALVKRSAERWEAAGLEPVGLHDCRHTFATFAIAAGVNAKALQACMGHSSIEVTYDRYGHLMPASEAEVAARLDAYLSAASNRGGVPTGVPD